MNKTHDEIEPGHGAMTRREMLTTAVKTAGTGMLLLLPMIRPEFSGAADADTGISAAQWTVAGKAAQFPLGQPQRTALKGGAILYITRATATTLTAVSAKCTHRGCEVGWNKPAHQFICPCHGAAFASNGKNLHGPRREPGEAQPALPSVPVMQKEGQVLVNLKAVPAPELVPGH